MLRSARWIDFFSNGKREKEVSRVCKFLFSTTIVINLCVRSNHFRTHTRARTHTGELQIKSNTKLRFMFMLV